MIMKRTLTDKMGDITSTVELFDLNHSSPLYHSQLKDKINHLRFNIPWDFSCLIGSLHDIDYVYVSVEEDTLYISATPLGKSDIKYNTFFYKENGFPQSKELDPHNDSQYIVLDRDDVPFVDGQSITYSYHQPYDGERHITIK